tara:strand:+ start:3575 stop:5113 length:1539 start_codon:yes stop_codon:yes gene_type:complete
VAQSTVKLIVDAQNAIQALQKTNNATKVLSSSTDKLKGRLDKSNRSLRSKGAAAKSAAGGVRTLTASLGPLLKALAVAAAARFVFVQSAELETQRKSLEVLTGSLSQTNAIIKELQDFGAVTPFTSSELIEQTKRLKAFGFETNELVETTKRLSDVAGATGADLQGIATAFGQIRAKGKLQQEENLQLLERGVDITTELKNITGLQGEAFASAMRKGQIGADLVNQALVNLTNEGGAFFGGATAQADTLNGKLSTLLDAVQNLARTIGEVLEPVIKKALDFATKGVQAIDKIFQRINKIASKITGRPQTSQKEEVDVETKKTSELVQQAQAAKIVRETTEGTVTASKTLSDTTEKIKTKFEEIGESIGSGITDALVGAINGTKSLGEAASNILRDISNQLLRSGINSMLSNVLGGTKVGKFLGFAEGGRPPVGRPSLVGEKGPEIFVPSRAGTIIPNDQIGGSSITNNISISVDASGSSVQGDGDGQQFGEALATAIQLEIAKQKRSGGLLA